MATTQLIIHFERLLRINIEILFGVIFSRYSTVLKSYPCHYGRFSKLYLKTYFSTQRASLLTMPKIIMWRYSIFFGNLLYYKINDFLGLQRKLGSIITSKNSQTMLKRCYLYACFIGGR